MKKWLIALFLLAFTSTGYCESWKLFYKMTESYDEDSMATSGDVRRLWIKSTETKGGASYIKYAVDLDCNLKTTSTNATYFYDLFDRVIKEEVPLDTAKTRRPIIFHKIFFDRTKDEYLYYAVCEGTKPP